MPLPASWSRWRILGGEGFNKEEFASVQRKRLGARLVAANGRGPAVAGQAAGVASLPNIKFQDKPADPQVAQFLKVAARYDNPDSGWVSSNSFGDAAKASRTSADAMAVYLAARQAGYVLSSPVLDQHESKVVERELNLTRAAERALDLTSDAATCLAIALTVDPVGRMGRDVSAARAFQKAYDTAPKAVKHDIKLRAEQMGYQIKR
jgi:hypothetical protein